MSASNTSPRKPLFDAVRRLIGRGFKQKEVDALDEAFERAFAQTAISGAQPHPDTGLETRSEAADAHHLHAAATGVSGIPLIGRKRRRIGMAGTDLIKRFEGCAALRKDGLINAYPDPGTGGAPWTIGWGATGVNDQTGETQGAHIGPDTIWTQDQCNARLASDLKRYARDVADAIGSAPTTQNQFDAMVSFHYNTGAIARATLMRKHVAGDHHGAAAEFARWNMASGRVLKGLVRRRAAEAKLYRS